MALAEDPQSVGVRWVVRRAEVRGGAQRLFHALVGEHAAGELAAKDRLEAHAVEIGGVADVAALGQFAERAIDRGVVVGHPFAAAARDQAHLFRRRWRTGGT